MEPSQKPEGHRDEHEEEEGERHSVAMQKFVGFVMMVLAWLQLLVAVSSGTEADYFPFLFYFFGLVVFLNGTMTAWYKYPLMGVASLTGLAMIYHIRSIGSATRWEKGLIVYGTILIVAYFIFAGQKRTPRTRTPNPPP
jgi:hypothetical protein